MLTLTPAHVTVWIENGIPARLHWNGVRYRVTDIPTPLHGYVDVGTHPLEPQIGWRFQGTSDASRTLVFDVHYRPRQEWELVAVYE